MYRFDEALEMASVIGQGRNASGGRHVPILIAAGDDEDKLFDAAWERFQVAGFKQLDARNGDYEKAIKSFDPGWPEIRDPLRSGEFISAAVTPGETLVIACGEVRQREFWSFLQILSVLYAGQDFPQDDLPAPRCIVVPSAVRVVGLATSEVYFPSFFWHHDGCTFTFDSL
ncbi:MAG: hypothetical protein M3O61_06660 [Gemmatimonadota bacterium]|nr:hypothetical protein [Gemmatimonadota bacterium]